MKVSTKLLVLCLLQNERFYFVVKFFLVFSPCYLRQ